MSTSADGLEKRRHKVAESLLRLISREELGNLATQLAMDDVGVKSVATRLAQLPRFEFLAIILNFAEPTIRMLQDILSYLERHGVAARTTGCALLLADPLQGQPRRVDLGPQEASAIASWTPKSKKGLRDDFFVEARSDWERLTPGWRRLLQRARPRIVEGDIDFVETAISIRTGRPSLVYEPDSDFSDTSAQGVLASLVDRVAQLASLLEELPAAEQPPACKLLLRSMRQLIVQAEREVLGRRDKGRRPHRRTRKAPDQRALLQYVDQRFLQTLDRIAEDLYLLADLLAGDRLFDIVGIDLWSSRPQLYEVWILVTILRWLEERGYRVELLKIEPRADGRSEWRLAYAKDSVPCAAIHGDLLQDAAIYYQLYRASGDMPDLCLMPDRTGRDKPSWAIDPKHADKAGYDIGAYRATALRYHDSFGAALSVIVEYFPRADIAAPAQNPIHFGPGALLIRDVSPAGAGLPILLDLLGTLHPPLSTAIICIDESASFQPHLEEVVYRARTKLRDAGVRVMDTFICFAERTATGQGMQAFMDSDAATLQELREPAALGDGTELLPLLEELRQLMAEHKIAEIILISDGSFSDVSNAADVLTTQLGIPVRLWT